MQCLIERNAKEHKHLYDMSIAQLKDLSDRVVLDNRRMPLEEKTSGSWPDPSIWIQVCFPADELTFFDAAEHRLN